MGTKDKPGEFDCYANAKPDEPMFVLLARDISAPHFVRAWAHVRSGNLVEVMSELDLAMVTVSCKNKLTSEDKINEALNCADNMETWRDNNYRP